jgi:hypothetical protein
MFLFRTVLIRRGVVVGQGFEFVPEAGTDFFSQRNQPR